MKKTNIIFIAIIAVIVIIGVVVYGILIKDDSVNIAENKAITIKENNSYVISPINNNVDLNSIKKEIFFFDGENFVEFEKLSNPLIEKKEIILDKIPEKNIFEFGSYELHRGVSALIENEELILRDANNKMVKKIPRPFSYDFNNDTIFNNFIIEQEGNNLDVFVEVDYGWLKNAESPIVIDPSPRPTFFIGDQICDTTCTYTDQELSFALGDLYINSGCILTLNGTTILQFAGSPQYIYVVSGGELRLEDTAYIGTIPPPPPEESCSGTPHLCEDISLGDCLNHGGCDIDGSNCGGVHEGCSEYSSGYSCESHGCIWGF